MAGALDIQRRIKSIKNTKKVTKAMEIVSAAKMKKAVDQVVSLRPYARAMQQVFENIAPRVEATHPLLAVRDVKSVLIIVIASNKGLCGGFNASIAKVVRKALDAPENVARVRTAGGEKIVSDSDVEVACISVGRKADQMVKRLGKDPIATFPELNYSPDSSSVGPLVKMIFDGYADGTYDKVAVIYTDYISPITQDQKIRQILPVSVDELEKHIEEIDDLAGDGNGDQDFSSYVIEPSSEEVITALMPRVLESQILHALFESNASKEASRMMAMNSATEAAGEIVDDLTLAYNKMRQAKITQEISEISAGRAALE